MNNPTDIQILKAMRNYGGGFASQLALAGLCADENNLARLKSAFPELWQQYAEFTQQPMKGSNEEQGK